ncbi:MAG: 30S ribosomal protein S10 [Candidatus Anstonellales archaeon]
MTKARMRLQGESSKDLEFVVEQINNMGRVLGIKISGIVRLPKKNLIVATRRTPCGDGSDTYERWWKVIHTWFIDIEGDEKALRQLLRVKVPENVYAKIIIS